MSDDFLICEHCVADNELRAELAERGTPVAECLICKHKGGKALLTSDRRIRQIFRALVRLNFSEWDYNGHVGGEELESLVLKSKTIFNLGPEASISDFENAFLVLEDDWYPESEEDIELGGGYWDGCVLDGLRDRRDARVEEVLRRSFRENYFEVQAQVGKLIDSIRPDITSTLRGGIEMVRGRVGVKARLKKRESWWPDRVPQFSYLPFTAEGIDRPPVTRATEGRLNRPRVSVMYLASDIPTAVAELRPHPGHLISTARFLLKSDVSVANFASQDIRNFLSDDRLEVLRRILSIADVINLPVQPDQQALYIITQLFADSVREADFDAVSFKSSLGPGYNLACFRSDVFEMVPGSEHVHEVVTLHYEFKDVQTAAQNYDKKLLEEDSDDPLSTLIHGMSKRVVDT